MKDRFDLEQEIMNCWDVVEDIDIIYHKYAEYSDDLANALLGLKILYQLKFERMFDTFGECVSEHKVVIIHRDHIKKVIPQ